MSEHKKAGEEGEHVSHSVPARPDRPGDMENERIEMVNVIPGHVAIFLDAGANRNLSCGRLRFRRRSSLRCNVLTKRPLPSLQSVAMSSRAQSRDLPNAAPITQVGAVLRLRTG